MRLEVRDLSVRYGPLTVLDGVSFTVSPGEWLMLVGPNGAGKSTTLGAVSQSIPYEGRVTLDGVDAGTIRPRALAGKLGMLLQNHYVGYAFTVEEIVRLGGYARRTGPLSGERAGDGAALEEALTQVGLIGQRRQSALTLSGGELQRAFLAQLLYQDPQLLLLDEPANHLDLFYQRQVFGLIRRWICDTGRAAVSVVHDLSLARAYGTHALLLNRGKTVACGTVKEALSRENLAPVYGLDIYDYMGDMLSLWKDA